MLYLLYKGKDSCKSHGMWLKKWTEVKRQFGLHANVFLDIKSLLLSVVPEPATSALPGCLLEMPLRLHLNNRVRL